MRSLITRFIPDASYEPFMLRSALALYLAVLVFGSIPGARQEIGDVASGLVLHLGTYALIAWLLASGLRGTATRKAILACIIVMAMGALDELIQSQLPYRQGTLRDWGVDIIAALLAATTYWLATKRKPAARRQSNFSE